MRAIFVVLARDGGNAFGSAPKRLWCMCGKKVVFVRFVLIRK